MKAAGTFEPNLTPVTDAEFPAGRMQIDKTHVFELEVKGIGQMISKRTEAGVSVYSAIEEVEGRVGGKIGSFTLFHIGRMSRAGQSLEVEIVSGSGTGELDGIEGTLVINQVDGKREHILDYEV